MATQFKFVNTEKRKCQELHQLIKGYQKNIKREMMCECCGKVFQDGKDIQTGDAI